MTETYVGRLVLALRTRDVPGERIGEVIAEVEAHVAESGETPAEAFGPAEEYAERISAALDRPSAQSPWQKLRGMLIAWPIALAAMLVTDGVAGLAFGERAEVTVGKLALFVLLPPAAALLVHLIVRRQRPTWPIGLLVVLIAAVLFGLPLVAGQPVLGTYPAWVALVAGAVVAAGTIPWGVRPNPVVDPRSGRNRYPLPWPVILLMAAGIAVPLLILVVAGAVLPGP